MSTTRNEAAAGQDVVNWIASNLENLKSGSAVFNGQRITMQTELVRFHSCYSCVVLFFSRRSQYFLKDSAEANKAAAIAVFASFLLGWWSLHGIIFTPITLFRNVFQTDKTTVGELINLVENGPPKAHPATRVLGVLFLLLFVGAVLWLGMNAGSSSH